MLGFGFFGQFLVLFCFLWNCLYKNKQSTNNPHNYVLNRLHRYIDKREEDNRKKKGLQLFRSNNLPHFVAAFPKSAYDFQIHPAPAS